MGYLECSKPNNPTHLPVITTTDASMIKQTTAQSGGTITSDGGSMILARGVCWSTVKNPTISDSNAVDASGTGTFISNIAGLDAKTTYHVRAYATNSFDTSYGNEITFTTLSHTLGESFGGGIIFYIDGIGQHGLIAGGAEVMTLWYNGKYVITGATGTAVGTGQANTTAIVNAQGPPTNDGITGNPYAASYCKNLVLEGYNDWFLPSRDELHLLSLQTPLLVGGYFTNNHWSSSEIDSLNAWTQSFGLPPIDPYPDTKSGYLNYVRPIRAF